MVWGCAPLVRVFHLLNIVLFSPVGFRESITTGHIFFQGLNQMEVVGGKWETVSHGKVTPSAITYNAAISSCKADGHWQLALALLTAMPRAKLKPAPRRQDAMPRAGGCTRFRLKENQPSKPWGLLRHTPCGSSSFYLLEWARGAFFLPRI